jgi:hypothetical protein
MAVYDSDDSTHVLELSQLLRVDELHGSLDLRLATVSEVLTSVTTF